VPHYGNMKSGGHRGKQGSSQANRGPAMETMFDCGNEPVEMSDGVSHLDEGGVKKWQKPASKGRGGEH